MSDKSYIPHKYQQEFHKSDARFRTLIAGRRGGKSLAGTIEALWWADKKPRSLGYIVAPTYGMLMDTNVPMVMDWLPQTAVESWHVQEKRLKLSNGSEIRFRSADNENSLRGAGIDWLWLDEASYMKPYAWEVLLPALTDKRGFAWITTTPSGYDWVYQRLYKPAQDGDGDYAAWQYRTVDNPHIDKSIVEKARKDMSEQMFRQEYLATFEKFSGLVYPDFEQSIHVKEINEKDLDGVLYFVGIDVGWNNPTAVVLMAEDANHKLYVLDEYYESKKTAPEIAKAVKGLVGDRSIEAMVIDPASKGTHQTSGMSMFDQLIENGLEIYPGDNDVKGGLNRVTQMIKNKRLYVHPRCVNLIREFELYSWKEEKDAELNRKEEPLKAHDHLLDALRYVAMSRPDWFERPEKDMYGREIVEEQLDFERVDNLIDL